MENHNDLPAEAPPEVSLEAMRQMYFAGYYDASRLRFPFKNQTQLWKEINKPCIAAFKKRFERSIRSVVTKVED